MFKEKTDNIEVYFICYKKEEMELVETYYDEVLDVHCWYFNAYLAYKHWQEHFKKLKIGNLTKGLLITAASKYLLYMLDEKLYHNKKEYQKILHDLKIINKQLVQITSEDEFLLSL